MNLCRLVWVRFARSPQSSRTPAYPHERLCHNMSGTSEVPQLAVPLRATRKSAEAGQKRK